MRHNAQRTALARSRPWKWDRRLPRRSDRCRAVRCLLALEEAGEDHGARGVDVVPGPSRAAAQPKRSGRASGVAAKTEAVDIGPAMAGIDRDVGEHAPLATPSRQEPVTCHPCPRQSRRDCGQRKRHSCCRRSLSSARPISKRWSASRLVGIAKRHRLASEPSVMARVSSAVTCGLGRLRADVPNRASCQRPFRLSP